MPICKKKTILLLSTIISPYYYSDCVKQVCVKDRSEP